MNENERIERLREKLYKAIDEEGVNSPLAYKISQRIDKLINQQYRNEIEYPYGAIIKEYYYKSYEHLKKLTKEYGVFPKIKEWNKYASEMNLLCHISIEYISGLNWNQLEKIIYLEIK